VDVAVYQTPTDRQRCTWNNCQLAFSDVEDWPNDGRNGCWIIKTLLNNILSHHQYKNMCKDPLLPK